MRIGDERCKIGCYDFEKFAAVISHFKFVAGMNVGEKRRSQLGSCDYEYDQKMASLRLSTVGDYRGHESLVIRLLHDEEQDLHFWFRILENWVSSTGNGDSIFLLVQSEVARQP